MKRFVLALAIISMVWGHGALADTSTGFIPGQIWYSKEPLVEGDTVKVYTGVWNGDQSQASFHVQFYDNTTLLGERDITVPALTITEVSISWKVTAGDHSIIAKISATTLMAGKKEQIVLDKTTTDPDRQFVPVAVKANATEGIKTEVDKVTTAVKNIIPDSVGDPVVTRFNSLDGFRGSTYTSVLSTKADTQKKIDSLNAKTIATSTQTKEKNQKTKEPQVAPKPLDATEKPIAYVKLFFLSVLAFIFGSKLVFYGLCAFIVFIVIRFIYRKIRNR